MASMKTLTVNGITYTIDDPDAVSYGTQQELTEEQKQLARQNIGAVDESRLEAAISDLTQQELDMNGNGIVNCAYYGIEYHNHGFFLESGGRLLSPAGEVVDIAALYGLRTNKPVLLQGIYPGWRETDAVNKAQLDAAIKDTIDKTCPAFSESGAVVACEPVEGYPLTVTAGEDATQITRCGKNLAKLRSITTDIVQGLTSKVENDGILSINGTSVSDYNNVYMTNMAVWGERVLLRQGTYTIKCELLTGSISKIQGVLQITKATGGTTYEYFTLDTPLTFNITTDSYVVAILQFKTGDTATDANVRLQIEVGSTATAFEPYVGEAFSPGDTVPALSGVNTVYADAGEVTVTGRSSPAAIIEKMREVISNV